eukprot:TRINITY_DN3063_c0_g1_i4.p1 TRINITY_DN3063_c0_g1~~TRINITY_DN3063_c0_g1_i4.p1  ORF type:complete len:623 (+),score=174.20 TRINITY_DN3063_c0_g1_i4:45-1913(+)
MFRLLLAAILSVVSTVVGVTTITQTCTEAGGCPSEATCSPTARTSAATQRVRKELRTLSAEEWSKVTNAIWTMKNTELAAGITAYGSAFKPYDYFVAKHAAATTDSRGDQAHFSDAFMTWHSAFVLEFEEALLAVDSSIGGMPYWDSTIAEPSILSETYFGSSPGTGDGQQVVDGPFANFPVGSASVVNSFSAYFGQNGADATMNYNGPSTGFLRGETSSVSDSVVVRYGGQPTLIPSADWETCANIDGTWTEWYACLERGQPSIHSSQHVGIGGMGGGDFEDPVTSPNDAIFMFHHANLDRNKMWYQLRTSSRWSAAWDFPAVGGIKFGFGMMAGQDEMFEGINLNEVVSSNWPFTKGQLGLVADSDASAGDVVTHSDVLCLMSPWNAPYTYDDFGGCAMFGADPTAGCGVVDVPATPPPTSTPPTPSTPSPPTPTPSTSVLNTFIVTSIISGVSLSNMIVSMNSFIDNIGTITAGCTKICSVSRASESDPWIEGTCYSCDGVELSRNDMILATEGFRGYVEGTTNLDASGIETSAAEAALIAAAAVGGVSEGVDVSLTATPTPYSSDDDDDDEATKGMIAGIVVGSVVLIIVVVVVVYCCFCKSKEEQVENKGPDSEQDV